MINKSLIKKERKSTSRLRCGVCSNFVRKGEKYWIFGPWVLCKSCHKTFHGDEDRRDLREIERLKNTKNNPNIIFKTAPLLIFGDKNDTLRKMCRKP